MPPEVTVPAVSSAAPPALGAGSLPAGGDGAVPVAAGAGAPESEGLRNLRTAYDNLKREHEPWSKLGMKPDEVTRFKSSHDSFSNRALELAKSLNYEESEVLEEFASDPYGTLQFLENEAAKSPASRDPADRFKAELDKRLGPVEKQLQAQQAKEANSRFDAEFDRLHAETFKDVKFDASSEVDFLYDVTAQIMKMDREALGRLRDGKVSDVAKYFNEAKGFLDTYYLARSKRESGKTSEEPGKGKTPESGSKRKFKLDDLIEDPSVLGSQYAG